MRIRFELMELLDARTVPSANPVVPDPSTTPAAVSPAPALASFVTFDLSGIITGQKYTLTISLWNADAYADRGDVITKNIEVSATATAQDIQAAIVLAFKDAPGVTVSTNAQGRLEISGAVNGKPLKTVEITSKDAKGDDVVGLRPSIVIVTKSGDTRVLVNGHEKLPQLE